MNIYIQYQNEDSAMGGNSKWHSMYTLLCKNYLQHSIRSPLACKKKDNVYCAVTGDNKQKAHMFFREVQMQLLNNSLLLHLMWKPRYFITRVSLPRHNQEKY